MNIQEKDAILSAVLDVPTPLKKVKLAPKNFFQRLLIFLKIKAPVYQMLYLRDLKMSTNFRLTAITNSLQVDSESDGTIDKVMELLHANTYTMAAYIATAIHNKNEETPEYLIKTIADEFSNKELHIATKEVYRRLDVQSFFESSALVRSLALM